jgi:hypothetical protein
MAGKLKLDVDSLQVASFETGEAMEPGGTVKGHDAVDAVNVTRTNCLTTPCCPFTVSCPTD